MIDRTFALALLVAPALAFSCGGKTSGDADGGPRSSSSSGGVSTSGSGSGSGGEPVDATPMIDSPAPMKCTSNGVGGSSGGATNGGPPPCEISMSETCSDGNTYHVDCQCPQATCVCYVTTASSGGSGGSSAMYPGCPSCTTPKAGYYAACGFPQ